MKHDSTDYSLYGKQNINQSMLDKIEIIISYFLSAICNKTKFSLHPKWQTDKCLQIYSQEHRKNESNPKAI